MSFDTTPNLPLQPSVHPLYFDANGMGFSFPISVDDNLSTTQLDGLINFGDAESPFPQQFDPILNDWVAATNLFPNLGYLAYALEEENAEFIPGELPDDFMLELESGASGTGHNLIAMPLTTPYPASESLHHQYLCGRPRQSTFAGLE